MHWLLCLMLMLLFISQLNGQTKIVNDASGYRLFRNGAPYYVKGVGGETYMDQVTIIGGNSIRTWGVENADKVLNEAQRNGLTVMLGLWLQTERQGFDYNDSDKVLKQLNQSDQCLDLQEFQLDTYDRSEMGERHELRSLRAHAKVHQVQVLINGACELDLKVGLSDP